MLYQFDKATEVVLKYISAHPMSDREMICCLSEDSNKKNRKIKYPFAPDIFNNYAYTCVDYLLELGLIYGVKKNNHTYYSVSAKGNAYKRYKVLNFFKEYFPYFVSLISLLLSITSLLISVTSKTP